MSQEEARKGSEKGTGQKEKTAHDRSEVLWQKKAGMGAPSSTLGSRAGMSPEISTTGNQFV